MSYTKLNLRNGHVLNQTDMAHIEDGIYNNDSAIEAIEDEIGSEELSGTILNKISRNASDITDIKDDIGTAETDGTILNKISKNTAEINQLKGIGKFLSNWNCATGKPYSDPSTLPYTYNTGDYYVITNIAETGPDYRPSGTTYTGDASTVLEEQDVKVGDFYIFDATEWLLMVNVPRTVTGGAGITISNNEVSVNYSTGLEVTNGVLNVDTDTIQTKITSSNKVSASNVDGLATVATSGSYNDLTNKPTIPTITIDSVLSTTSTNPVQNKVINTALAGKQPVGNYVTDTELTTGLNTKQDKITASNKLPASNVSGLSTVATSGSYTDLSNKPTIPTITIDSALNSSSINPVQNKTIYSALNNKQNTLSEGTGIDITDNVIKTTYTTETWTFTLDDDSTVTKTVVLNG